MVESVVQEEMQRKIAEVPLKDKNYRYSDIGFILLQMLAEELSGKPLDEYLWQEFYKPMGWSVLHICHCATSKRKRLYLLL